MLRAERDLARARLASDADGDTAVAFAAAITGLRAQSTPYHLAHGLLDHAEYLVRTGDADAAAAAVEEAREIAARLRCQPLLDRAGPLTPQDSPTLTPQDSPRVAS
jgi:L-aminopeptidase/D-esterase-like protein